MNIQNLRASVPPSGNSVLAQRLRIDVAPPTWIPFVVKAFRVVVCLWFSFQFTVGLFNPFKPPVDGTTALGIAFGVTLCWTLNRWCQRYDPRVHGWLVRRINYAPPLQTLFRDWNDLTTRLAASPYAVNQPNGPVRERDHIFLGTVHGTCWPFLFDISKPRHVLLTGATSSGKTHRVILPTAVQMIRRRTRSVVVFDLKGDKALFFKLASEASKAGLDFRWVNLDVGSSYIFNPLSMRFFDRLSEDAQVQLISQALGLDSQGHQADVFFSDLNERILRRFYRTRRPHSLRELLEAIEQPGGAEQAEVTAREWELAMHLRAALDRISSVLPFNAHAVGPGVTQEMLSGAVELDDVLTRPQVLYFYLPTSLSRTTSRAGARLGMQAIVAAARSHTGRRVPVDIFPDEFQEVVGTAAIDSVLRQAREFGLSFWLACQQLSALQQGQLDCLDAVTGNVALQIHFSATDRIGHDHLIRLSGEASRWLRGESDTADGVRSQLREAVRTRLSSEDVARLNATSELAATFLTPQTTLAPFRHAFFLRTAFAISAQEYERLRILPFPLPTRFTVFNRVAEPAARVIPPTVPSLGPNAPLPIPQSQQASEANSTPANEAPPPPNPKPKSLPPPITSRQKPTVASAGKPPRRSRDQRQQTKEPEKAIAPQLIAKPAENSELANYLKQLRLEDAVTAAKPQPDQPS